MEWQREVLAIEATPADATGLGARAVEQRRGANGTTEEWELQITEFEPDHVLGITGQSGAACVTERHEFVPADSDTRYTLTIELTGSSQPPAAVHKKTVEALIHLRCQLESPRVPSPWKRVHPNPRLVPSPVEGEG
jgi:hypothetical protein